MAARALASLTVSFGMVSIPVKLYAATQPQAGVSFNLLHAGCGSRLRQQYVCAREGVVVERTDIVKGYEFAKDQYVTFTPEELKELEEKGTQTIEIDEFVPADSIDPIYYDKAYFLGPDKGGAKPYALLAESMRQTGQTAVGRYAARGKQYIVQLRAVPGGLVMQQLLYAPEVRRISDVSIEAAPVKDAELALAKQLIGQISSDRFDPARYEDAVRKRIETAIQKKIEGEQIAISPSTMETSAQVIDLMEALKASLQKAPARGASKTAASEPAAPRIAARVSRGGVPKIATGDPREAVASVAGADPQPASAGTAAREPKGAARKPPRKVAAGAEVPRRIAKR
jgi:DNA end-binding protein Ku